MSQALCVSGVVMLSISEELYPAGALVINHGALSLMLEALIVLFANWQRVVMKEAVLANGDTSGHVLRFYTCITPL